MDDAERDARRRRREIAPLTRDYSDLESEMVLWPYVISTSRPSHDNAVASTDSRGNRLSRSGEAVVRSDDAPPDAAFVLGGSFVFGVGASSDAATLPSRLWERTGTPFVNLGIRKATSTQELVSALPFAERAATFVVCSGLNNFAISRAAPGLDPLFGPTFLDGQLRKLTRAPVDRLVRLLKDASSPRRFGRRDAVPLSPELEAAKANTGDDAAVRSAAAFQLRDLRALRRVVPDGARVVFALQPVATQVRKEESDEERELFAALDVIQSRTPRWERMKRLFETQWPHYAALLEDGCRALGVPFVDLSQAEYSGWCFVDRIHMTDRGYELAAAAVASALDEPR